MSEIITPSHFKKMGLDVLLVKDSVTPKDIDSLKERYLANFRGPERNEVTITEECDRRYLDTRFIQTHTGIPFWPLDPRVEDIRIEDIAFGLSNAVRFANQGPRYNVAQHSVIVSRHCQERLKGLLHDGSEAYMGDIARMIKQTDEFTGYRRIESGIQNCIYRWAGLTITETPDVKRADLAVFSAEVRDLMQPWCGVERLEEPIKEKIRVWSPRKSEREFLKEYRKLRQ